jgi:superfamily II DNA or RNA helicase
MKPFKDQEKSINEIMQSFETEQKLFFCLATGGGKTACFSFIAQRFIKKYGGKVLALMHREELINQTLSTLRTIDVSCESVIASKKKMHHQSNVYVAMVQTLKNRLKTYNDFLKDVGLIICDEAHLLQYSEVLEYYPNAKVLAVSATPTTLKKIYFSKCSVCGKEYETVTECCNYETYEYTKKFSLSEIYGKLIIGTSITELINSDRLVRELVYCTGTIDRSKLTIDAKTGDYDNKSTDEYYSGNSFDVVKNYEIIAKGKKTIIFNSSSKINLLVLEAFQQKGYTNIKLFDSVNETENRKKVLQWFKETPDAILLNVNCFTTGFDEPTLECVILNRATKSLSLFHQMVGRGGRKCNEIYKPYFTLIDGGGNVAEFGKWSDEVDWKSHFYIDEKPKPKKEALDQTKQCPECGLIHAKNELQCPECGFFYIDIQKKISIGGEVAKLIDEIPKPNGKKIVDYCQRVGRDKNFAWLILQNQILDLFIFHSVTFGTYQKAEKNGKFEESMRNLIKEPYNTIQNSHLESGTMRTKAYIINKIKDKLCKYYQNQRSNNQ